MITKIITCAAISVFILGVVLLTNHNRSEAEDRAALRNLRNYQITSEEVRYFVTCAEGYKFVATHSGHGINLAGPIGECNDH